MRRVLLPTFEKATHHGKETQRGRRSVVRYIDDRVSRGSPPVAQHTREDILQKVSETAADHFETPNLKLRDETTAADVEGWDSIAHIQLMMRLEEEFDFRFSTAEISSVRNVGELVDRIIHHTS